MFNMMSDDVRGIRTYNNNNNHNINLNPLYTMRQKLIFEVNKKKNLIVCKECILKDQCTHNI